MEQAQRGDLGWHAAMLLDEVRVGWFARAIATTIRPDDLVLDIGSGTGLLAMLAARAGARHVYAIETSPLITLARDLIADNGLSNRITVVHGSSFEQTLPERADVVISETLGAWGADEGIAAIMADAQQRLARPDARFIPEGLTMWLAPAGTRGTVPVAEHLEGLGLDFSRFFNLLGEIGSGGAQASIAASRLLAAPQAALTLKLGYDDPKQQDVSLRFDLAATGAADALVGWFSATASGVPALETGPSDPPTMWGQLVLPLAQPISSTLTAELILSFEPDGLAIDLAAR